MKGFFFIFLANFADFDALQEYIIDIPVAIIDIPVSIILSLSMVIIIF